MKYKKKWSSIIRCVLCVMRQAAASLWIHVVTHNRERGSWWIRDKSNIFKNVETAPDILEDNGLEWSPWLETWDKEWYSISVAERNGLNRIVLKYWTTAVKEQMDKKSHIFKQSDVDSHIDLFSNGRSIKMTNKREVSSQDGQNGVSHSPQEATGDVWM